LFICFLKISANDNLNSLKIVFGYDIKDIHWILQVKSVFQL